MQGVIISDVVLLTQTFSFKFEFLFEFVVVFVELFQRLFDEVSSGDLSESCCSWQCCQFCFTCGRNQLFLFVKTSWLLKNFGEYFILSIFWNKAGLVESRPMICFVLLNLKVFLSAMLLYAFKDAGFLSYFLKHLG